MPELGGADENSKKWNHRVCAFSYKNEKDLPGGQKLLTCARCCETCYVDRESQLEHWPIHKHSCCKPEHENFDLRQVQEMSFEGLVSTVKFLLATPDLIKGRYFLCIFKEILDRIIYNHDISVQETRLLNTLHSTFMQVLTKPPVGENGEDDETSGLPSKTLQRIWAIPGFASFFLSDDIFLSKAMGEAKREGLMPPQPQKYIDGVLDPATKWAWFTGLLSLDSLCIARASLRRHLMMREYLPSISKLDCRLPLRVDFFDRGLVGTQEWASPRSTTLIAMLIV